MSKVKYYIESFRLRTLPLSVSGVILGSLLAIPAGNFKVTTFVLAIVTTLLLQILSNMSNELGDTLHGTDTEEREGPQYSLQSGTLTIKDVKRMIVIFVLLSALSGIGLVASAFDALFSKDGILILAAGGFAIIAALCYTLGKHPYGYMGFGDIAVFIFFGLLSVIGANFLMSGFIDMSLLLPASACGLLITGVLNINNTRDMETDKENRRTIPTIIGEQKAKIYQVLLEILPFVCMVAYCIIKESSWYGYLFLLMLPFFIKHLKQIFALSGRDLDPLLPELSKMTLVFCALSGILQVI